MTSKIKVDNINKVSDDSNIIKKCGTTTTIGSGASNPIVVDGSAVTLGRCGGTVALASGATQTGFGRTGTVDWQTTPKTATFTAVSGEGYFANTTGSAFNMNLPAGVAGAIVSVADYAATWQTNNLTVVPNGTDKIGSINADAILSTQGQSVTFVFVDSTQGWINTMDSTSNVRGVIPFITATGGTITCSGDFKIHTFTGPGTFTVNGISACAPLNVLDYVVVGGAGSGPATAGGEGISGGGGAGGFRFFANTPTNPQSGNPASPLNNFPSGTTITATVAAFPITVGAGGPSGQPVGSPGSVSTFSTVTSAGGGRGGRGDPSGNGQPGGSGGGGDNASSAGTGNTPPTSPAQGNNGGPAAGSSGGGGGGALAVGSTSGPAGGNGGAGGGVTGFGTSGQLCGGKYYFSGGGGGGNGNANAGNPAGTGGLGGGAPGLTPSSPTPTTSNGTVNTGGGGGGASDKTPVGGGGGAGGAGGSGIVIIRYKFQ